MMPNNAKWMTTLPARPQYGKNMNQKYMVEYIGENHGIAEVFATVTAIGHPEDVRKDAETWLENYPDTEYVTIRLMRGDTVEIHDSVECYKVEKQTVTTLHLT